MLQPLRWVYSILSNPSLGILLLGALAYAEYSFVLWTIEANDIFHYFIFVVTHYVAIMILKAL